MKILEKKLFKKGWNKEEISQAKLVLRKSENKKHPKIKLIELITYWIFFLIIIVGGIIGSWLISPFLLIFNKLSALIMTGIFGLFFGGLISILVKDIENLETHHHFLVFLFVIISSIGTSIFLGYSANKLISEIPAIAIHNPYLIGVVFSACTLIPYGIFLKIWWNKHESL